jgi:lipopolysaccharide/colanic/teichoic acid biosynthesis glycosyltransferase
MVVQENKTESHIVVSDGVYARYGKRAQDFCLALCALLVLWPLLLLLALVGAVAMKGNPFFLQKRPGLVDDSTGRERVFTLIKFRTMTCDRDADGKLLPDDRRVTPYGKFLRDTSLDELPELLNILVGDMAVVGPRPQLVRDMVFMTAEQRLRHRVRPGLTGLAQVSGPRALLWENKLAIDLQYIQKVTFAEDWRIIWRTAKVVFGRTNGCAEASVVWEDYGDHLLRVGAIDAAGYAARQAEAQNYDG